LKISAVGHAKKHASPQQASNDAASLKRFSTYSQATKDLVATTKWLPDEGNFAFTLSCNVFRHVPNSMDGALALILMLTVNLEKFNFAVNGDEALHFARDVLERRLETVNTDEPGYPVQKISDLSFEWKKVKSSGVRCVDIPTASTLQAVHLSGCAVVDFEKQTAAVGALTSLKLTKAHIARKVLNSALIFGLFTNLRQLSMVGIDTTPRIGAGSNWSAGGQNDYHVPSRFAQALAQHAPNLEVFEFCDDQPANYQWPDSFGSFKDCLKLHTLRLDVNRLLRANGKHETQAIEPRGLLPANLRQLHVHQIHCSRFNKYYKHVGTPTNQAASAVAMLVDVARTLPLDVLSLEAADYSMEYLRIGSEREDAQLTDETFDSLEKLVNDESNACQDIRVYLRSGPEEEDQRVFLLGSGHRFFPQKALDEKESEST
jgi:hypothetical protein